MQNSNLKFISSLCVAAWMLCSCAGDLGRAVSPYEDLDLWQQTNGPYGGFINAIAVSHGNLVACTSTALYRLHSDGLRWEIMANFPVWLRKFAFNESAIFAGTAYQGVYRSTDGGLTWSAKNNGLSNLSTYAFAFDPPYIFVGTDKGVCRSSDNGETWSPGISGIGNRYVVSLLARDSLVLAGTYDGSGISRSTDYGLTWKQSNDGLNDLYVGDFVHLGDTILAGTNVGVSRSTDGGQTWTDASRGLPDRSSVVSLSVIGTAVYVGTYKGLYCSEDNGSTWTKRDGGRTDTDLVSDVTEFNHVLFASSHSGVFRSQNKGDSWTDADAGIAETWIGDVAVLNSSWIAMTEFDPAYRSTDKGKNWKRTSSFASPFASCWNIVSHNGHLYGTSSAGLFRSDDLAATWTHLGIAWSVYAFCAAASTLFAGTDYGVYCSTNEGVTWTVGLADKSIRSFAVLQLPSGGTEVFAGGGPDGILRTTDGGSTWSAVNKPTNITTRVYALGTNLYACAEDYSTKLYRSTDRGATWSVVYSGFAPSCFALAGHTLYAGTYEGRILQSSDDGASWQVSARSLTPHRIMSLDVEEPYLIAGTEGSGVWTFLLR